MSKANAAMNIIAEVITNVTQDCFAQASNLFNLDIKSEEVIIDGLTVNAYKTTTVGTCSSNTGISEGLLQKNLDDTLSTITTKSSDDIIRDAFSQSDINMKTTIKDGIRVEVVNRCLAVALNSIIIRVKDAQQFTLRNVTIKQKATAEIKECIGNVIINIGDKSQTLEQFLERNEALYDVAGFTEKPACPDYELLKKSSIIVASSSLVGAVLISAIFLLLYYLYKYKII